MSQKQSKGRRKQPPVSEVKVEEAQVSSPSTDETTPEKKSTVEISGVTFGIIHS
jgi:hypothetical protein